MHLLLGVIRTLRGYDNNKDESDSYRRCGAQAGSSAAQERPFHCRVSFFLLAFLRAWPLSNPACYFTCAACCCLGTYLNGLVLIHNSWRRDYLAKMLLKKLYVNQLQANKNSTQEPHHALESGIFNFLFWRVRRKDVSIVVAFQYTGYTLW